MPSMPSMPGAGGLKGISQGVKQVGNFQDKISGGLSSNFDLGNVASVPDFSSMTPDAVQNLELDSLASRTAHLKQLKGPNIGMPSVPDFKSAIPNKLDAIKGGAGMKVSQASDMLANPPLKIPKLPEGLKAPGLAAPNLSGMVSSLNIDASVGLPPSLPSALPELPNVGDLNPLKGFSVPKLPSVSDIGAKIPGLPSMPKMPTVPKMTSMPEIPSDISGGMPGLKLPQPAMPKLPKISNPIDQIKGKISLPEISVPSVTDLRAKIPLPSIPKIPTSLPSISNPLA
ncbi:hypothetical protein CL634_02590 [bacterium]|nr:hypothetical protein [bacterium]